MSDVQKDPVAEEVIEKLKKYGERAKVILGVEVPVFSEAVNCISILWTLTESYKQLLYMNMYNKNMLKDRAKRLCERIESGKLTFNVSMHEFTSETMSKEEHETIRVALKNLAEEEYVDAYAVKGEIIGQRPTPERHLENALEFWQKDSAAGWNKCEEYRKENIELRHCITEIRDLVRVARSMALSEGLPWGVMKSRYTSTSDILYKVLFKIKQTLKEHEKTSEKRGY